MIAEPLSLVGALHGTVNSSFPIVIVPMMGSEGKAITLCRTR